MRRVAVLLFLLGILSLAFHFYRARMHREVCSQKLAANLKALSPLLDSAAMIADMLSNRELQAKERTLFDRTLVSRQALVVLSKKSYEEGDLETFEKEEAIFIEGAEKLLADSDAWKRAQKRKLQEPEHAVLLQIWQRDLENFKKLRDNMPYCRL
jgi:hypothetical protein